MWKKIVFCFYIKFFPKLFDFWLIFQKRTLVRHLRMGSKKADFLHTLLFFCGSTIPHPINRKLKIKCFSLRSMYKYTKPHYTRTHKTIAYLY